MSAGAELGHVAPRKRRYLRKPDGESNGSLIEAGMWRLLSGPMRACVVGGCQVDFKGQAARLRAVRG